MTVRASVVVNVRRGVTSFRTCNSCGVCYRFDTRSEARRFAFGK